MQSFRHPTYDQPSFLCSNKYSGGKANTPESEKSHSAIQIILWSLCVVWAVFLSIKNYETFQIGGFRDDAEYVVATRSLVHSDEYGLINLPGEPGVPRFPFGYPLILAPLVTLFPDNPDAMKWPALILGLLLGSSVIIKKLTPFLYRQSWIRHLMLGAIVMMLISIYSFRNFPADLSQSHIGDLSMRTAWIRDNTEPSSVIMTEEPPTDFIYGMRRTVPYPQQLFSTAADFFNVLLENHVNYFLVAPRYQWQGKHIPGFSAKTSSLLPLLEKLQTEKLIELTYSSEQNWVKVFKVKS